MAKKQEENQTEQKEKEYTISLTKNEIIQKINDNQNNENFKLALKVRDGIRLLDETEELIGMIQDED